MILLNHCMQGTRMKSWLILSTIHTTTNGLFFDRETSWQLQDRLVAPERQRTSDRSGRAVAISNNKIVSGAYWDSSRDSSYIGAVHVYTPGDRFWNHDAWEHQAKITSTAPGPLDNYGSAVDIDGLTLVVGAQFLDGDAGSDQGGAFLYQQGADPNIWTDEQLLRASNAGSDDQFGAAVAISQNTVVIGAPTNDLGDKVNFDDAGAVYIFHKEGDLWTETNVLKASDAVSGDFFGGAVAIHDDIIVVGARGKDKDTSTDSGVAYVFTRNQFNVWTEETILTASDMTDSHGYGVSTATDGTTIVIGAIRDSSLGENAGAVYIYSRDIENGDWAQETKLLAGDGKAGDQFGISLAVDGNVIVIGAHLDDKEDTSNVGSAYVFRKVNGSWRAEQRLTACDGSPGDGYGFSVDVESDQIAVGSFASDIRHHFGRDAGVVYVYKYDRKRRRLRARRCRRRNSEGY